MTRDEITAGFAEIPEHIVGSSPDEIDEATSFTEDLDVDSVSMVEIVVTAEERFTVTIPDTAARDFRTVADAVSYVLQAPA
jgi:acyl carrier protein